MEMKIICEALKNAIIDERKGIEEYAKTIEDVKKMPPSREISATFIALQEIKADEERHAILLEHIKDAVCR